MSKDEKENLFVFGVIAFIIAAGLWALDNVKWQPFSLLH